MSDTAYCLVLVSLWSWSVLTFLLQYIRSAKARENAFISICQSFGNTENLMISKREMGYQIRGWSGLALFKYGSEPGLKYSLSLKPNYTIGKREYIVTIKMFEEHNGIRHEIFMIDQKSKRRLLVKFVPIADAVLFKALNLIKADVTS